MANPRKFSEKIALHNQKQAEGTAAFEQIMREVGSATREVYQKHLHINQNLGAYRGGSLPNVNQIGNNSIDLQSALNSLENMKQGRENFDRVCRERSRHVTSQRSRTAEHKRADVSPYGSAYLSPPPENSWRRTNSDSAIHQTTLNQTENYYSPSTPPNNRRVLDEGLLTVDGNNQMKDYWDPKKQLLLPSNSRPKSCEVPGINIYHSEQDPGVVHIPISNNTGSLPDLTNLQFPSPLATPLDAEDPSTSPYSTSPQQHSPATLSPTTLSPRLGGGIMVQQQTSSSGTSGLSSSRGNSPGPSPSSRRRHHHNLTNLVIGGNSPHQSRHQQMHLHSQNSFKISSLNSRYLHKSKGLTLEHQGLPLEPYPQSPRYNLYHQPHQQQTNHHNSSQTISQSHIAGFRDSGETSCSAPQSPVSQNLSPSSSPGLGPPSKTLFSDPNNYYIPTQSQSIKTNTLQQQFEQFNMIDNPPVSTSINNAFLPSGSGLQYSQVQNTGLVDSQDLLDNSNYYSEQCTAQLSQYPRQVHSPGICGQPQQANPQTPQTPSSIPDIILTDFSTCTGTDDPISRHDFVKDIGTAMAGMPDSFDTDLFPSDDALKAGLDPIDFDGLQILTDPNIVTDPATEDSFRLDRL